MLWQRLTLRRGLAATQDLAEGRDIYLRLGASTLKHRTALVLNNIFSKMVLFQEMCGNANTRRSFLACLTEMVRTKKYFLSASFLVRPMDAGRADALWRLLMSPEEAVPEEVAAVYRSLRSEIVRHRNILARKSSGPTPKNAFDVFKAITSDKSISKLSTHSRYYHLICHY
jgi:hypothetical protein